MSKVITGARAVVYVKGEMVGLFESCTVANSTGVEAIHLLGRYSPDEIAITSKEAVNISCSGFRVSKQGKTILPKVPKIQDLLGFEPFTLSIQDRQMGSDKKPTVLETIVGCVPTTDNTNYNAKATSKIAINYMGIRSSDEDGTQDETAGAASLP
jgi:hypothetical protein